MHAFLKALKVALANQVRESRPYTWENIVCDESSALIYERNGSTQLLKGSVNVAINQLLVIHR